MKLQASNTFPVNVNINRPTPVFARINTVIEKYSVLVSTERENRNGRKFWLCTLGDFHCFISLQPCTLFRFIFLCIKMEDTTVGQPFLPRTA